MPTTDLRTLHAAGLNLWAVFDLAALPASLQNVVAEKTARLQANRLILIGHAGPRLWQAVQESAYAGTAHPIDEFTLATVRQWMTSEQPAAEFSVLYPGTTAVDLQALGQMAGWHHPSPFMVGINARNGPWFAYRALILARCDLAPTPPETDHSPCTTCTNAPCITACPPGAAARQSFNLKACLTERCSENSPCADRCLARLACPVAHEQRYPMAQIRHSYGRSLADLRAWIAGQPVATYNSMQR